MKPGTTKLSGMMHFFTKGELGPLNTNLYQDEVQDLLGLPEKTGRPFAGTDKDNLLNLFYPNLTLTFLDECMVIVILEFPSVAGGMPTILEMGWFEEVRQMDYSQFTSYLKEYGIGCKRAVGPWDESEAILLPSAEGISVYFDSETKIISKIVYSTLSPPNWQTEDCW